MCFRTRANLAAGNDVYYISARTPSQAGGAPIPSLQATAVSPDGQTVYGVNSAENLLVVANASNLTQRQTFGNHQAQAIGPIVAGLGNPVAVAVSPDGNDVYVVSGTEQEIAIFSRSSTGDLVFQSALSVSGIGSLTSIAVDSASSGSDVVFVGGTGGVAEFQGNTTTNFLGSPEETTAITSINSLSASSDETLLYAVSSNNSALYVLDASTLALDQALTNASVTGANPNAPSSTLEGASAVAAPGNPAIVGALSNDVFVVGQTSGTLSVFSRDPSTNVLTWLQTLEDGVNGRAALPRQPAWRSLRMASTCMSRVTRRARWPYSAQPDGTLVLDQLLRGSAGLEEPDALTVDPTTGDVYVASEEGLGGGGGGLASFSPLTDQVPHTLSLSYSNIQTLNVEVGNSDNTIGEPHYATTGPGTSTPAQLTITAGDADNTITLLDIGGTTTVTTGSGSNQVTAYTGSTDTAATLVYNGGSGNDFFELDAAAANDAFTINLGSSDSTAQVEGTALDGTASVNVNGAGPAPCSSTPRARRSRPTMPRATRSSTTSPRPPTARSRSRPA